MRILLVWKNISHPIVIRNIAKVDKALVDQVSTNITNENMIWGIEQIINNSGLQNYIILPIAKSNLIGDSNNKEVTCIENIDDVSIYSINYASPEFYPININTKSNLFFRMKQVQLDNLERNEYVHLQLLLTKSSNKEQLIEQYLHYLKGYNYVGDNRLTRRLLSSIHESFQFLKGKEREQDSTIEQKLSDHLFHFEFRIAIVTSDGLKKKKILTEIEKYLADLQYFNQLILVEESDVESTLRHLLNRAFTPFRKKKSISLNEVTTIFNSDEYLLEQCSSQKVNSANENLVRREIGINHTSKMKNALELIEILPEGKTNNKKEVVQDEISVKITQSLIELGVIQDSSAAISMSEGATLKHLIYTVPLQVKFNSIKKNLENVRLATGIEEIEIKKGTDGGTIIVSYPKEDRSIVYLRDLISNPKFLKFAEKARLPFILGLDEIGNSPVFADLAKVFHILVAGSTGSGKSVWLIQFIMTLCLFHTPETLRFYIVDPKRIDFKKFQDYPHVQKIVTEVGESLALLTAMVEEMDKRYSVMEEYGIDELEEFDDYPNLSRPPYIVCIIDEFSDLILQCPAIENLVVRLGQKARACGIHIVCGTQRPEVKVISGLIKANLPTKIGFLCGSNTDYKTIFGTSQPFRLLGLGDGVVKLAGAEKEFIRFQGAVIHEDKMKTKSFIKALNEKMTYDKPIEALDIKPIPTPLEILREHILTTDETGITALKASLKIDTNVLRELMDQLVEEGILEKSPKGRYKRKN